MTGTSFKVGSCNGLGVGSTTLEQGPNPVTTLSRRVTRLENPNSET